MDEITKLLRQNPESALDRILTEYTGLVYNVAAAVLGRSAREEIEECVSDAFFTVYEKRNELDFSEGSIKAYLCAAARNMAVDRLRKHQRAEVVPLDERTPAGDRTDAAALKSIESGLLIENIHALGEPDSTIVICRYYFGMRTKEIAKKVGMKANAVDQRLRRALIKLKNLNKGELAYVE